jgi:quinol-cytochrome oxidoreductase complex cytochrome b subunit
MAVVLVFLLIGTGLLLKFVYEPVPSRAYDSILYLQSQVPFGQLLRNLHRWSGNGLVLLSFLHLLRVFYTGAFAPPRQFNWIIGLVLFAAVTLSNFTGYLLPWDQLAYWAITISTSMLDYLPGIGTGIKQLVLGGTEPGPVTLLNFYALHTAVLPALLLFVLPFHFWRVRKANGLVVPRSPGEDRKETVTEVNAMPHLIVREVSTALLLLAVILVISIFYNAPLAEQANPGLSPNPTKAPWYFMGIQEMLMHLHPFASVLVLPSLMAIGLFCIPYVAAPADTAGIWFRSGKGRVTAFIAALAGLALTVAAILFDELYLKARLVGSPNWINNGLVPLAFMLAGGGVFYLFIKKRFNASHAEAIQSIFTLLVTAFIVLTVTGVWFRGAGMQLMWAG